jgi:hypothetical protein
MTGIDGSCGRGSSGELASRSCERFGLVFLASPSVSLSGELLRRVYG